MPEPQNGYKERGSEGRRKGFRGRRRSASTNYPPCPRDASGETLVSLLFLSPSCLTLFPLSVPVSRHSQKLNDAENVNVGSKHVINKPASNKLPYAPRPQRPALAVPARMLVEDRSSLNADSSSPRNMPGVRRSRATPRPHETQADKEGKNETQ